MMDIDKAFEEFIEFPEGSSGKIVTTVSAKLFAKYCTEKLQEENERLLAANRHSEDMYRQIDDERKRLQAEVERLRAESERRQRLYIECETDNTSLINERQKLKRQCNRLKAQINGLKQASEQERDRLKAAVSLAIDTFRRYDMDVETYPTIEHISMMRNLKGVLAAHDAEVIERAINETAYKTMEGDIINVECIREYANQLRQQAKEVQS